MAIDVGQSLKGEDVGHVLNEIVKRHGLPRAIKTSNDGEFISNVVDKWAYKRRVELDLSRLGKPIDNAGAESFDGQLRRERLNAG